MPRKIENERLLELQIINQLALLNQAEVALLINKHPSFVKDAVEKGHLRTLYGNKKSIPRNAVDEWLKNYSITN